MYEKNLYKKNFEEEKRLILLDMEILISYSF